MKLYRRALIIIMGVALAAAALPALAASAGTYLDWAMLYLAGEMPDRAIDSLKKAVKLEPKNPELRVVLGLIQASRGSDEDAISEFRTAIASGGVSPQVYALLGDAYRISGDVAQARASYERCVENDPASVTALAGLGTIALERHGFADARKYFARIVELAPERAQGYVDLSSALIGLGQHEEAVVALKDGIAKAPGEPGMAFELGRLLEKLGREEEARVYYQLALKWDASYAPAEQALKRLGSQLELPGLRETPEALFF